MSASSFPATSTARSRSALTAGGARLRRLLRGDLADPAWARPALLMLLVLTAVAYTVDLTSSGYANSFYAAAVQAGTKSWKAFLFGSLDSSNFITVDKPPASLWAMEIFTRVFGFSSASMLIPNVLEGLVAVALLYSAVKRWAGTAAGLLAGGALAVTPAAALMFRFNNPDALLVCLTTVAAYCLVRAVDGSSTGPLRGSATGWLAGCGVALGFAFLAKMLAGFIVVPGFALVYLLAAPGSVRRRLVQTLAGGVAMVVAAGWWVALVCIWPVGSRPMIDGSPTNNILNLVFGYNGLGRVFGGSGNPGGGSFGGGGFAGAARGLGGSTATLPGGGRFGGGRTHAFGGGGASFSGSTGPLRLFNDLMGAQAAWLIPAALATIVVGLWLTRRLPRTDRIRAAILLFGSWLVVTGVVFSFSSGTIHTYYTVALAPAIAALVGVGATLLWRRRAQLASRALLAAAVAGTGVWAIVLLRRIPSWEPWLVPVTGAVAGVATVTLLVANRELALPWSIRRQSALAGFPTARAARPRLAISTLAAVLAVAAVLIGPLAYTLYTVTTPHSGTVPQAGPTNSTAASLGSTPVTTTGTVSAKATDGATAGGPGDVTVSSSLRSALQAGAGRYRWVAATGGSQSAAELELATGGDPVMAIGGFDGEGGEITLATFEKYVKTGEIHYYVPSSGGFGFGGAGLGSTFRSLFGGQTRSRGGAGLSAEAAVKALFGGSGSATAGAPPTGGATPGAGRFAPGAGGRFAGGTGAGAGGSSDTQITTWVEDNYKSETIGGQTVYSLAEPK